VPEIREHPPLTEKMLMAVLEIQERPPPMQKMSMVGPLGSESTHHQ
jgi:hypothetical protein